MVDKKTALKISAMSAIGVAIATYFIDVYTWKIYSDAIAPCYTAGAVGILIFGVAYFGMIK